MRMQGAVLVLVFSMFLGANTVWAQDDCVGGCDIGCCDTACCPTGHFYVGAEAAFLKPHMGALGFSADGHPDAMITPTLDYEASPRFWIGFENASGLGLRATYWQIDGSARKALVHGDDILDLIGNLGLDLPEIEDLGLGVEMEAETIDLEVTQRGCLGCMELEFAGGIRYGRMRTGLFVDGTIIDDGEYPFIAGIATEFEGLGPTLALDARRAIGCNGFALVGGARGAWLFGSTDAFLTGDAAQLIDIQISAEDHVMQVYEVNLGVEWSRCLSNGGEIAVAALWESQVWEWAPVAGLIHQDVGLSGPTLQVAFTR
ncbi:MAG: hypothetical protein HQ582_23130 [Planctomycetes bacterium]|nr:hypothetical protein [Planctomycetota bacterium]